MQKLTQQYVQSLFEYKDGNLYWKVNNNKKAIELFGKYAKLNEA